MWNEGIHLLNQEVVLLKINFITFFCSCCVTITLASNIETHSINTSINSYLVFDNTAELYEKRCSSCHGKFGYSIFSPITISELSKERIYQELLDRKKHRGGFSENWNSDLNQTTLVDLSHYISILNTVPRSPYKSLTDEQQQRLNIYCQELLSKPSLPTYNFGNRENFMFYTKNLRPYFGNGYLNLLFSYSPKQWTKLFEHSAVGFIREFSMRYPKAIPILTNPEMLSKIISFGEDLKECSENPSNCGIIIEG